MKIIVTLLVALTLPVLAFAQQNNIGTCGWGSKLFNGQRGIAPQVLAVTTNGTSGSQTFGISSGTSGCTQDGVVTTTWRTAAFIDGNMTRLARDMSRGGGESLDTLSSLLQVQPQDQTLFTKTLQQNFSVVFASPTAKSTEVAAALKGVLAGTEGLQKYSANI